MRVWALASCGSLLALAACSADQANGPTSTTTDADGEGTAAIADRSQRALRPTATASPMARPEVRPRQSLAAPGAPSARAATEVIGPETQQLRARIQRLRAQQQARSLPQTGQPLLRPAPATVAVQQVRTPAAPGSEGAAAPAALSPNLPDLPRAVAPSGPAPSPALSSQNPPPSASPAPATSLAAADLQSVAAATLARNYPIAPPQHQGYGQRPGQQPLVVPASPTTARLHGEPGGIALADSTETAPGRAEASPGAVAPAAIAAHRASAQVALRPEPSLRRAPAAAEAHRGRSPAFSPTAPPSLDNLPPGAQTTAPGNPPESLPLNGPQPLLRSSPPPVAALSAASGASGTSTAADRPVAHLGQAIATAYPLSSASPGAACADPLAHGSFSQPQFSPGDTTRPPRSPTKMLPETASLGLATCLEQPADADAADDADRAAVEATDRVSPAAPLLRRIPDLSF